METTALRQLLKSLCSNLHWEYSVFWKLNHRSQMVLGWEDGYWACPKTTELVENIPGDIYFKGVNEIYSLASKMNIGDDDVMEYRIGRALADMSCHQYAMGDGAIGEVAYTGSHRWVLFENDFASECNSKLVPEYPEEWLLQFAAGIKTIVLVPVLPHGVVQLGSLEWVAEDLALIAYVIDRFNALYNMAHINIPFTSNRDIQSQSSSSLMSGFLENPLEPSDMTITLLKAGDLKAFNHIRPNKNKFSTLNEVLPMSMYQDAVQVSETKLPQFFGNVGQNVTSSPPDSLIVVSTPLCQPINTSQLETLESKLLGLSCLNELQAYPQFSNYNLGASVEPSCGISHLCSELMTLGDTRVNDAGHKSASSITSLPIDSELHEALGQVFQNHIIEDMHNSSFLIEDSCRSSSLTRNIDMFNGAEPSSLAKADDANHLLEAIVASVSSCIDDSLASRFKSSTSSTTSSGRGASLFELQSQSEASALINDDSTPWSDFRSSFVSCDTSTFTGSVSFNNTRSKLIDKEQQGKPKGSMQPRKGNKLSNASKRRARIGENQRPRPRDRQMIQDRLEELRQLVPNGAKCSIDSLLDRVVMHMMHLRSIIEQAEKLRHLAPQKVVDRKSWGSSKMKNSSQNGTSWAFEFGDGLQSCPIVVEDLEYPGHMLIEMLCNERGLFLEIAQVIRNLEFTILKGTIHYRSNNAWAQFIIEGQKGFHRMDMFWPLMHLWKCRKSPV
ncbi:hypothetical protein I3843_10G139500 [Carya illinoinensis]|uniref:BHLH domain-containing protein n=1 Tax=Carya illinoinensis TaxID=32201 RepID=A0A8T1PEL1_CARIL|nr:transcription factor LHW-like [Carya illinoinensis]KAG6640093.1 hypothetical protein CIPAW_10G147900 [Carya illinoinensis]KAG7960738.1 hypothetical protein I3843_10G139500 [Carya illinoinensis]